MSAAVRPDVSDVLDGTPVVFVVGIVRLPLPCVCAFKLLGKKKFQGTVAKSGQKKMDDNKNTATKSIALPSLSDHTVSIVLTVQGA